MIEQVTRCDVCKKTKGEGNKWLKVWLVNAFGRFNTGPDAWGLIMTNHIAVSFNPKTDKMLDICSESCLQVELGKALEQIRCYTHPVVQSNQDQ